MEKVIEILANLLLVLAFIFVVVLLIILIGEGVCYFLKETHLHRITCTPYF